jgi:hypothetical protein
MVLRGVGQILKHSQLAFESNLMVLVGVYRANDDGGSVCRPELAWPGLSSLD